MNVATQNWWCRTFQWFCSSDSHNVVHSAPEIDATYIGAVFVATILATFYMMQRHEKRR